MAENPKFNKEIGGCYLRSGNATGYVGRWLMKSKSRKDGICFFFCVSHQVKMVEKSLSLPQLLKWAIIVLMLYSIWKCVKTDSEDFRSKNTRENFVPLGADARKNIRPSEPTCGGATADQPTCGGNGGCISATGAKLLPVLDPCFNMREICKQCILLEDHLFQNEKRCTDCIKKHFLCLEGLAEEAITLDKKNEYHLSRLELPEKLRKLQKRLWTDNESAETIAQELRQIRKPLMAKYYNKF